MDYLNDLEDLYIHLESDSLNCEYPSQVVQLIKLFRDKLLSEGNKELAKKAQIELEALSFSLRNGTVEPFYILKDKEGNNIEFPKLSEYSDEYLDYIISRMESSKNPFLKSRYAHILWCSKRKHGLFAQIALDSYQKLLERYQDEYTISGNYENELVDIIKNIYYISKNFKDINVLSLIKIKMHKLVPIFEEKRRLHFNLWVPLVNMLNTLNFALRIRPQNIISLGYLI